MKARSKTNCLRFANPAEATGGLEAWRLGGWGFGASGILQRRHRRCLQGIWERWAPAFLFAEVNSKVCRHVFVCVRVCVFRRTCCVCKCFQRGGAPALLFAADNSQGLIEGLSICRSWVVLRGSLGGHRASWGWLGGSWEVLGVYLEELGASLGVLGGSVSVLGVGFGGP